MPLNFSVARGGKIFGASIGHEHKQNGACMSLEKPSENTATGLVPPVPTLPPSFPPHHMNTSICFCACYRLYILLERDMAQFLHLLGSN